MESTRVVNHTEIVLLVRWFSLVTRHFCCWCETPGCAYCEPNVAIRFQILMN